MIKVNSGHVQEFSVFILRHQQGTLAVPFNLGKATLTGAIDIIVVEREDGSLHCTPFHVRFGKLKVPYPKSKKLKLVVNGEYTEVIMKLNTDGEAFFELEA